MFRTKLSAETATFYTVAAVVLLTLCRRALRENRRKGHAPA